MNSRPEYTSGVPERWTLQGRHRPAGVKTPVITAGPPLASDYELVDVMPVSEHETEVAAWVEMTREAEAQVVELIEMIESHAAQCGAGTQETLRLREALVSIAAMEPGLKMIDGKPQPWTHWHEQARAALAPAGPSRPRSPNTSAVRTLMEAGNRLAEALEHPAPGIKQCEHALRAWEAALFAAGKGR